MISAGSALSQQLSPFVVSSSGGVYSNDSGILSFTTGEMTAVETFTSPGNILTQGFQQAFDFGTFITEYPLPDFSFGFYPNPTDGNFNLFTESELSQQIEVKILDMLGREIFRNSFYHQNKTNIESFDLSNAAHGLYLITLLVKDSNSQSRENQFITKIHIVR